MKKYLYFLAAATFLFAACNSKNDPDPTPTPTPEVADLTLTSDKVVDVEATSSIATVKFTAGKTWTATLSYPDGEEGGVVLAKASGDAGDVDLKVTFQTLAEDLPGRIVDLTLKAGSTTETVRFFQGVVFWTADQVPTFDIKGGNATVKFLTNTDVSVRKYDGADEAFPWAPITVTESDHAIDLAITVDANAGYDPRTAYVKFTVPAIQVPVVDDETGEETGETEDLVYRMYIGQEGNLQVAWAKSLTEDFRVTSIETDEETHDATASIAYFDGKLLVSDSYSVHAFDPATGAAASITIPEGLPVQSITNDDAGNLIFAELIPYLGVGKIYAVKASDTNMANPVLLIPFVNEAWAGSHGADKVAAKGDVFGNGIVTMMYGGLIAYGGLSYCLAWEITNGQAAVVDYSEWSKTTTLANGWLTTPALGDNLWLSNRAAFVPAGTSAADGYFYCGYDGLYNVYYYNGSEWAAIVEGVGDWDGSIMGMGTITWEGKKILAGVRMGYTFDWGGLVPMPSSLWIIDVTDPTSAEVLSSAAYDVLDDWTVTGGDADSTVDVVLKVESNGLAAYVVDTSDGLLQKFVFPKL